MKKKIIISILTAVATGMAFAQGQGQFSTTAPGPVVVLPKPPRPAPEPPVILAPIEGAVQVAIRTGNPIQLLNPAAPARYGNAQEHVTHDPNDPGKPKGIALFAWTF
jgi:hypothetical protein